LGDLIMKVVHNSWKNQNYNFVSWK